MVNACLAAETDLLQTLMNVGLRDHSSGATTRDNHFKAVSC